MINETKSDIDQNILEKKQSPFSIKNELKIKLSSQQESDDNNKQQDQLQINNRYNQKTRKIKWRNEDEQLQDYLKTHRKSEVKQKMRNIDQIQNHLFKIENQKNPLKKLNIKKVQESKISQYLEGGDSSQSDSSIAGSNSQLSGEDGTFSKMVSQLKKNSNIKRNILSEQKKIQKFNFVNDEKEANTSDKKQSEITKIHKQESFRRRSISNQTRSKYSNVFKSDQDTFRNMTINKNLIIEQLKAYYDDRKKQQKKIDQQTEINLKKEQLKNDEIESDSDDFNQIKNPFKRKINEQQKTSNINNKKIQLFDSIIDEYVNILMIKYDQENNRSSQKQYNSLLDLINKRNEMGDIEPKPFFSALKGRQIYAFQNQIPIEKMDVKEADKNILIEQKQHLETFQKFISMKIEKLKHMNKKIEEDEKQGKEMVDAMNKQMEINQMFQNVYDQQIISLQQDLKKATQIFCEKMKNIHLKLDALAWKKQVEQYKKNQKNKSNLFQPSDQKLNESINYQTIDNQINSRQKKSLFFVQSQVNSEGSSQSENFDQQ